MKIAVASDHGGFELKKHILEYLTSKNIDFADFGTYDNNSCDYPIYAKKVAKEVSEGNFDKGILVCGTGQGMAICANKTKGIRAVCVSDTFSAKMTREHNNSNILTLGQRVIGKGLALEIVETWLNAEFKGERHQKRIDMIE